MIKVFIRWNNMMGGMSMKLSGKYRHTDILAAWQQVAICQERQSDLGRTRQDRK